jgi:uncharacterized protein
MRHSLLILGFSIVLGTTIPELALSAQHLALAPITTTPPANTLVPAARAQSSIEQGVVSDQAALLDQAQRSNLSRLLDEHNRKGPGQIVLLTIGELPPNTSIEKYAFAKAIEIAPAYSMSDQILVVIAMKDRQVRIETSPNVAVLVPDAFSKKVIDGVMVPKFKQALYFEGIREGIDSLIERLEQAGPNRASGQDGIPCHQSARGITDRLIVPGERIGPLRLDQKISDIVQLCGPGVVAVEGGPRRAQLFSVQTWNPIGLWIQFDSMTGNVVWISIEVNDSDSWAAYSTADGIRLGTHKEELVRSMGTPERVVTEGGFTSFYYDRRGVRFTMADAGRFAGKVGSIRVVSRSTPRGDTTIVPGKRISSVEVGMGVDRAIALLGGGYHEGEAAPGVHLYYWPHLGLSILEKQGHVISVRAGRQTPADAADISYRTASGLGQGSMATEIKDAFGEPPQTDRGSPGEQWFIFRHRGVAFGLDDRARVKTVDVFQPESQ